MILLTGGHAWQGGMRGRGGTCGRGHAWQWGVHGRGACMVKGGSVSGGGCAWWKGGMCGEGGGVHGEGGLHGMDVPLLWDTACQCVGGMHPTRMHSCLKIMFTSLNYPIKIVHVCIMTIRRVHYDTDVQHLEPYKSLSNPNGIKYFVFLVKRTLNWIICNACSHLFTM